MKNLVRISLFNILFAILASSAAGQTVPPTEKRVIEVTGSAEALITPNEFTFKITLVERVDGKKKITIEDQEEALKRELAAIGVEVQKDLTVFDLTSVYVRQRRLKDTLASKDYRLKIRDLDKVGKLQDVADRNNISRLDLIDSTHTELIRFRKETKMEAIRAAKMKAEYLLGAIGERVGKPVFVREVDEENNSGFYRANANISSNSQSNVFVQDGQSTPSTNSLNISQIKLRFEIFARFEIE